MTAALDHWHPVLLSGELREAPAAVTLLGRRLAVFRTGDGRLGALDDACPHRRMPLSEGYVRDGQLVCPYHGWRFSPSGAGSCPGSPEARPSADGLDAAERHGAVWVKARSAQAEIPDLAGPGDLAIGAIKMRFRAPLELVTDNLAEMEHTGETHLFFGFDTDAMASVEVRTEVKDDEVRVVAVGPQRRLPRALDWLKRATGSSSEDLFVDEATFRFAPVHAIADSYWVDRRTRARRSQGLRSTTFFVPCGERETDVVSFFAFHPGTPRLALRMRPLILALLRYEMKLDRDVTEKVAASPASLEGMALGRFDEPIRAIRERIAAAYFRRAAAAKPAVRAATLDG
ncbi:Rieske 2Fe-2S domain-containing protein [Sorangium sp. So ce260]|uniref:Rieske 2Fe-2S domain-containing protein n=1 Tax=Sorangium sp. So ce260 TaxID=3133291 RepID=UPI003F62D62E